MLNKIVGALSLLSVVILGNVAHAQSRPIDLLEGLNYKTELSPSQIADEMGWADEPSYRPPPRGTPQVRIIVDKAQRNRKTFSLSNGDTQQTMRVFVNGMPIYQFDVSTGAEKIRCPKDDDPTTCHKADTPTGTWRIQKNRRYVMYNSKTWNDAEMPYAQFYDRGWAIHATTPNHYSALGRRDSGGCVRLHLTNAKLMFQLVEEYGAENTAITIYDSSLGEEDPVFTLPDLVEGAKPFPEVRGDGLPFIY